MVQKNQYPYFEFKPPLLAINQRELVSPGPATFIPVERIFNQIAMAENFNKPNSSIGIPLGRKYCI